MTKEQVYQYIRNHEKFVRYFGEEIFLSVAMNFPLEAFSKKEYVREGSLYFCHQGFPLIEQYIQHSFPEDIMVIRTKARDTGYVSDWADVYLVPDTQNESKLIKACIEKKWPFMATFRYSAYHLDRHDDSDEVYLKPMNETKESRSFYLPLKALVEMDFLVAENRHVSYFKDYCRSPSQKKYLEESLALLQDSEVQRLKWHLENGVYDVTPEDVEVAELRKAMDDTKAKEARKSEFIHPSSKGLVLSYLNSILFYTEKCAGGEEVAKLVPQLREAIEKMETKKVENAAG